MIYCKLFYKNIVFLNFEQIDNINTNIDVVNINK